MAEQFVLKGVNRLEDYTSSGTFTFKIKNDPRGGDTWQIPQWWAKKANNTIYNSCTVIDLEGTNYVMIIPSSVDTQLMVTYDDDVYNINFSNFSAVDRIAITSKDQRKIVIEYLLPSVSGGAIAKRILQAAATIGDFTISGKGSVDVGGTSSYQSNATPDADDAVYAWTVEQGGSAVATSKAEITSGATSTGCTVSWKEAGAYDVKCTITSDTASDSPKSDSKSVTCNVVNTVGTSTISTGSATPEAQKTETYGVTTSGNNVSDLEYAWSVVDATAQITNKNAASTGITFEAAGNATVQCVVSSPTAADNDSPTKSVVVSTAKTIGDVSILPSGAQTVEAGAATNFQAQNDGNIVDATYAWSSSPSEGVVIDAATSEATDVTFNNAGAHTLTCVVSSVTANDSPQSQSKAITVNTPAQTMGNISLGGDKNIAFAAIAAETAFPYTSTPSETVTGNTSYSWTAKFVDADGNEVATTDVEFATPTAQNSTAVFKAPGVYKIRCKYTNQAYDPVNATGMRSVEVAAS